MLANFYSSIFALPISIPFERIVHWFSHRFPNFYFRHIFVKDTPNNDICFESSGMRRSSEPHLIHLQVSTRQEHRVLPCKPVSYTHLDVYKRQMQDMDNFASIYASRCFLFFQCSPTMLFYNCRFLFHSGLENGHSTASRGLRQFRIEAFWKKPPKVL